MWIYSKASWTEGLPPDQTLVRRAQWRTLREDQGSDGFFNIIQSRTRHQDFRRQVWDVIDAITEDNPESLVMRREVFDRACEAGCTDLAAATFTDLQILTATHRARTQARNELNGTPLVSFSRSLFRLRHVDDIAAADLESSRAIINNPATSAQQKRHHRNRIHDPHEMVMAYRFGLKDRLQLPFQPEALNYIGMADVTPAMLDAAYRKIVALDDSPEEFQALVALDLWQDYITHKYLKKFEDCRQPFQDQQAILDSRASQQQLTEAEYKAQTNDLQALLAIEEATLIQALTRQELQPRSPNEEPSASNPAGDEASAQTD
ncbi:NEL-type E3 ubiquitin ligase domain-containing protein [Pseudomonas lini]|uniref:NEL-type E3 ubiquitin ligase domain-containing protein n=1 Tax=Pseudomonas lini TaxID=163011 RepID=UPI0027D820E4|nr:NEL-type E3 ubiquitin ligase domain-containing protein [Pseudomonas lini]